MLCPKLVSPVLCCLLTSLTAQTAENSRRKIRPPLGDLAAKAGSAVPWRKDVASALAEAKQTGKPVFWYVPAVRRSPMDRKPVIDRYMMGGPFSWPSTIVLLREHFVPVKQAAGRDELSRALELQRGKFIEPGYVVLDGDGSERLKVDQITTVHPQWFEAPLRRIAKQPAVRAPFGGVRAATVAAWHAREWAEVAKLTNRISDDLGPTERYPEQRWLRGAALLRMGQRSEADREWHKLVEAKGGHPLGWKAALEREGHGPFVHGFEVYGSLPDAVLAIDPHDGSRAPAGVYSEVELWQRSVAFLAGAGDGDGVYRDSTYDFGGTDGLPNVHAAVTCLAGEALLAALARHDRGELELSAALVERVTARLFTIRSLALDDDWLALSDRDEIVWPRAYAIRFLLAWKRHRPNDAGAVDPGVRRAAAALLALQPETGVWFHEYGNPFAIATALQALAGVKQAGFEVPQANLDKGVRALAANRTKQGAFSYGQTPSGKNPRASVEGAAGRMPLCELGLYLHGASDQAALLAAVAAGRRHHPLLAGVRKYDDHANRYGYGGFFFWFDMLGRAEAIAELDDGETRREHADALHALVMTLPEFDGCFVDSHELGRCYGTAMALLCFDTIARARR